MPSKMSARPVFGQPIPPPYRAPPPSRAYPPPPPPQHQQNQQQQQQQPGTPAYSKFNVSEPNVASQNGVNPNNMPSGLNLSGMNSSSYERHTINHDHSQRMQHGLRNMLNHQTTPKHNTLDAQGQNAALQHLRSNGLQPPIENHHQNGNGNGSDVLPNN